MLLLIESRMQKIKAVPLEKFFFFFLFFFSYPKTVSYFEAALLSATAFTGNLTCLLGGVMTGTGLPF